MRIAIVGGGPGGLYFSILLKKLDPPHEVVVYERNAPDDTFGFGVVFSDETLDRVRGRRPARRYAEITRRFARWSEIDVHYRGEVDHLRRPRLLGARAQASCSTSCSARAAELGVDLRFRTEARRELDGRPRRRRRRRQQHAARAATRTRSSPSLDRAPGDVRLARHRPRLRRVHVLHRRDRARRLPGPRLSVQRRDEHVHRRDDGRGVARAGLDRATRTRASRSARSCSPTCSTATA